jgi:hypothetical protein
MIVSFALITETILISACCLKVVQKWRDCEELKKGAEVALLL